MNWLNHLRDPFSLIRLPGKRGWAVLNRQRKVEGSKWYTREQAVANFLLNDNHDYDPHYPAYSLYKGKVVPTPSLTELFIREFSDRVFEGMARIQSQLRPWRNIA